MANEAKREKHTGPVILWIDHNGNDCKTRCFDEHHAVTFEGSLDAEGLHHRRAAIAKATGSEG